MVAGICNVEYIAFDYIFHKLIIQLHPALWFNEKWEKHKKYMEKGKKKAEHAACKRVSYGVLILRDFFLVNDIN